MIEQTGSSDQAVATPRLKIGVALFFLSVVLPLAGIPALVALGFSKVIVTSLSGVLLVGSELLGIAAIAVMGKPGFAYIKNKVLGFLKRHGPPSTVNPRRYFIGLVMFCVPFLFAWISVYTPELFPGFVSHPVVWAVGGDVLLLTSLFVLGGDFWDKIRALFTYNARAEFSQH
ncbi:MAG: hypothetical protein WBM41_01330 [Arenicellales bacterium]